ncbi:hypothetical protein [Amycolatopsis samaneae]|uniref:Tip attachment protein J domain-containing protein n=1 Tax=Amycolatopsis samaneae TaxID=664691 RepID=A0ABW5GGY9_9PSEU
MGDVVDVRVEAAFDAPAVVNPVYWSWTDLTPDVLSQAIAISRGRQDEAAHVAPSSCRLTLDNRSGAYTPAHPGSPHYPNVVLGTPLRVSVPAGRSFLTVPRQGAAACADPAGSAVTGDLDVRVEAALDSWAGVMLAGKWDASGGKQSWALGTTADEDLLFVWSADGTVPVPYFAPFPAHLRRRHRAVRVSLVADDGHGGLVLTLYAASSIRGPWTVAGQVAAPITTSLFASDVPIRVGQLSGVAGSLLDEVHRVEVRRGAGGPLVAAPDFTTVAAGASAFTDAAGRAWTVEDRAAVVDRLVRFSGFVAEWAPSWPHGDLSDPASGDPGESVVQVTAAGVLRRLEQNKTVPASPMRAELQGARRLPPRHYWPCEDPAGVKKLAPAEGAVPLSPAGDVTFGAVSDVDASGPLPAFRAGQASAMFARYADVGEYTALFLLRLPADGVKAPDTPVITLYGLGLGVAAYYSVETRPDGALRMRTRSALGGDLEVVPYYPIPFGLNGVTVLCRFSLRRDGDRTTAAISVYHENAPYGIGYTTPFSTLYNPPQGIVIGGGWWVGQPSGFADLNGTAIGHLFCDNAAWDVDTAMVNAARGWSGETAGSRLLRLCAENEIPLALAGRAIDTEPLGAQRAGTTLPDLLRACAEADGGILSETRTLPGLSYRTRMSLYNQPPALILNAGAGDLAPGFAPVLDDRSVHNDVTVRRTGGGTFRYVDTAHVRARGRYDAQAELNVARDAQLADIAAWQVHLGTDPGMRYPQVTLALTVNPALLPAWFDLDLGDRLDVTELPPQHPPGPVGLLAQGYTETLRPYRIDAEVNASPAAPWQAAQLTPEPDGEPSRADTDDAQLTTALDATTTTFQVRTTRGPLWITTATHPSQFPFLLQVGGETMRVTAITGTASPQTFTVARGVDGLTRSHAEGSAVTVAPAPVAAR